jgi:hypothetical protein
MPRLHDEECDDDKDGTDWAEQNTHMTPEQFIDPTIAALSLPSTLDEHGYVHNWSWIASQKRIERNYKCQECRVNLTGFPQHLHVHHLDRVKTNNDSNNLLVLCVLCHSQCEGHFHLQPSDELTQFIESRRGGTL